MYEIIVKWSSCNATTTHFTNTRDIYTTNSQLYKLKILFSSLTKLKINFCLFARVIYCRIYIWQKKYSYIYFNTMNNGSRWKAGFQYQFFRSRCVNNGRELCESITERIVSWIIAQQCAKSVWRRGRNLNRPCHPKTDPSFPPLIFGQISESGAQLITARYYCGSDINLSLRVQPNFPRACRDRARAPCRSSVNKSTYEDAWFSTRERAAVSPLTFRVSSATAYSALLITKVNAPAMFVIAYAGFDNLHSITSLSMKTAARKRARAKRALRSFSRSPSCSILIYLMYTRATNQKPIDRTLD